MNLLKTALGFAASAYLNDTMRKPRQLGQLARQHCDSVGKPLLLIHDAGVVHHVFGAPVKAEVQRRTAYPVRAPDDTFGAVLAVGVLECLRQPERALAEWRRVADRVYVVVPSWYSPHTWLSPEHRWVIDPAVRHAMPLWTSRRQKLHLLQVSDKRYGRRRWSPTPMPQSTTRRTTRSPQTTSSPRPPQQSPSSTRMPNLPATTSPSAPQHTDPASSTPSPSPDPSPMVLPDLDDLKQSFPGLASADFGSAASEPTGSWNSVSHLTVVSADSSSES